MRPITPRFWILLLAGLAVPIGDRPAAAESDQFSPVTYTTADGVELVGKYAPGKLGRKSPAVIVLGETGLSDHAAAAPVAARLAADGCAVLRFDFRGHGRSTAVAATFWDDPTNRKMVRGYSRTRQPDRITHTDFRPGYLPVLVNDIAAARAFLERRNDAGECNTGQFMLVGFGRGATLGTLWLGAEWQRYRSMPGFPVRLAPAPEGQDVVGCVWVEVDPTLDRRAVPLASVVKQAEAKRSVFFGLVHTDGDEPAAARAADWAGWVNDPSVRNRLAVPRPTADDPTAVTDAVAALVADMRAAAPAPPWDDRDFVENGYVWASAGRRPVAAKAEGEDTFRPVPGWLLPGSR